MTNLEKLRDEIACLDNDLAILLAERYDLATDAVAMKRASGSEARSPETEEAIVARVRMLLAALGAEDYDVAAIYEPIFSATRGPTEN